MTRAYRRLLSLGATVFCSFLAPLATASADATPVYSCNYAVGAELTAPAFEAQARQLLIAKLPETAITEVVPGYGQVELYVSDPHFTYELPAAGNTSIDPGGAAKKIGRIDVRITGYLFASGQALPFSGVATVPAFVSSSGTSFALDMKKIVEADFGLSLDGAGSVADFLTIKGGLSAPISEFAAASIRTKIVSRLNAVGSLSATPTLPGLQLDSAVGWHALLQDTPSAERLFVYRGVSPALACAGSTFAFSDTTDSKMNISLSGAMTKGELHSRISDVLQGDQLGPALDAIQSYGIVLNANPPVTLTEDGFRVAVYSGGDLSVSYDGYTIDLSLEGQLDLVTRLNVDGTVTMYLESSLHVTEYDVVGVWDWIAEAVLGESIDTYVNNMLGDAVASMQAPVAEQAEVLEDLLASVFDALQYPGVSNTGFQSRMDTTGTNLSMDVEGLGGGLEPLVAVASVPFPKFALNTATSLMSEKLTNLEAAGIPSGTVAYELKSAQSFDVQLVGDLNGGAFAPKTRFMSLTLDGVPVVERTALSSAAPMKTSRVMEVKQSGSNAHTLHLTGRWVHQRGRAQYVESIDVTTVFSLPKTVTHRNDRALSLMGEYLAREAFVTGPVRARVPFEMAVFRGGPERRRPSSARFFAGLPSRFYFSGNLGRSGVLRIGRTAIPLRSIGGGVYRAEIPATLASGREITSASLDVLDQRGTRVLHESATLIPRVAYTSISPLPAP